MKHISNSEKETFEIAKSFAKSLKSGDIIALSGDLGAGKTAFVKGVAFALGCNDIVSSPTFTLVNEYTGTEHMLYHFDVYRIGSIEEMDDTGYEDYFFGNGVCLVEWAELVEEIIPEDAIWITVEKDLEKGWEYRKITVRGDE